MIKKLARHYKRLNGLPQLQKLHYVLQTLNGELLRSRALSLFGPRLLELTLTDECQCRCVHCYNESGTPVAASRELTTAEIVSVLEQAADLGCNEVCLSGGEPLLRQDILQLVRHARRVNLIPKMNTNGLLLSPEMISGLKDAGLAWCSVSIDSTDQEKHDTHRGYAGCYVKAVEGLRELVRQGVAASITTCASRDVIRDGELPKIIALGHEIGVETVRLLFPVPIGGYKGAQEQVLTFEERELVRQYLKDPLVTIESPKETSRCTAAVTKINVLADGRVTPCVFVPHSYGNVRQETLKKIWERTAEFDRLYKPAGKCPMCNQQFRELLIAKELGKKQPIKPIPILAEKEVAIAPPEF